MKIYPVVSNEIQVELEDGTLFELHEGNEGLSIRVSNAALIVRKLNPNTLKLDEVWKGHSINLIRG